jgi:hypothetical protein
LLWWKPCRFTCKKIMGFPQTWVLSMWPLSKIKRSYISWWIYQTTKCTVIIIKIVINDNSFFETCRHQVNERSVWLPQRSMKVNWQPHVFQGLGGSMSWVVGLSNNSYKPIINRAWVRARRCKLQKGCTRLAVACDKVYQLLVHGRWLSPGTPDSSTTKTDRHDIAEILLKVALDIKIQNSNS